MATKKQNRRHVVRRARRGLNKALDLIKQTGNAFLTRGYGSGVSFRQIRERVKDDIE